MSTLASPSGNLGSANITPDHASHIRRIGAQDAVATWLNNLDDNDDSDNEEPNNLYGREVGPDMIPYMGFNPTCVEQYGLVITSNGRSTVAVQEVQDLLTIPEYPHTSPQGVATIVHITEPLLQSNATVEDIRAAFAQVKNTIQYDMGRPSGGSSKVTKTHLKFLSNNREHTASYHMQYHCSGIRVCGYVDESIVTPCSAYDRVDVEHILDSQRRLGRREVPRDVQGLLKEQTENIYQAFLQQWQRKGSYPCTTHQDEPSCQGQDMKAFHRNKVLMVGCPRSSNGEPWHTAWSVPSSSARVDIPYLQALCMSGICSPQDTCTWVGHVGQKRAYCGYDHTWGPKPTQKQACSVLFDIFIPRDTYRFPFFLIISRGSHLHHPPLPHRPPEEITRDILRAISSIDTLALTTRQFLMSPQFYLLKEKYGNETLRAISASLNVEDRITLLIRKQRLLQYPEGCSMAGVEREFLLQRQLPSRQHWIRQIFRFADGNWLVICCTYAQAMRFTCQKFLEIDLSFKMVAGKVTLFSIAGWDEQAKRSDTYIYAFCSSIGTDIYTKLFELLFNILGEVSGELVKWHHIHSGAGIHTITADMDGAQAKGLGNYLHMLDPSRDWTEHLQYLLIFCQVHIRRNFRKRFPNHNAQHMLHTLWECESVEAYTERIQSMCTLYPELKSWFKGKQKAWIVSAFVQAESKIPNLSWVYARKNSNLAEITHSEENNAVGRKVTLLTGVIRLKKHCQEKDEKRTVELQSGQQVTWRNTSSQSRIQKQISSREAIYRIQAERRRDEPDRPYNPLNPFDSEEVHTEHAPSIASTHSEESQQSLRTLPSIRPTPSIIPSSPIGSDSVQSERSMSIGSVHTGSMLPPPSRKRTQSATSESTAHAERMRNLTQRRNQLLAEKRRREEREAENALLADVQSLERELYGGSLGSA